MKKSSYSTYPLTGMNVKNTREKLKEEMARNEKTVVGISPYIQGVIPDNKYIPAFSHTMDVSPDNVHQLGRVVDLRQCTSPSLDTPYYRIRNHEQFALIMARARLEILFQQEPIALRTFSPLPIMVWCRMLTDNISRRCNLTHADLPRLNALAAIYYFSLFEESGPEAKHNVKWEEDDWLRVTTKISSQTRIPAEIILEVWDGTIIKDVMHFVSAVKEVIAKPSVDILNVALLFNLVGGFKFGPNMREVMAVALEHPATFIALVENATANRSNDPMFNVTKTLDRGNLGDQLRKSITRMLSDNDLLGNDSKVTEHVSFYS